MSRTRLPEATAPILDIQAAANEFAATPAAVKPTAFMC